MVKNNDKDARASIAWRSAGGAPDADILASLAGAGYRVDLEPEVARQDLLIIDVRAADAPAEAARAIFARHGRRPHAGAIVLCGSGVDVAERRMLERIGDVRRRRKDPTSLTEAVRARLRLAALAEEAGERVKSLIAFGKGVDGLPSGSAANPPRVLFAGEPSPLLLEAWNSVGGFEAASVMTASQAIRALDIGKFDCAVFAPADDTDLLIALAKVLRRHRDHRRVPVIMAAASDAALDALSSAAWFDAVTADQLKDDLTSLLTTATARSRSSDAMRAYLRSAKGFGGADPSAIACGAPFFAVHASRLIERARETGKPLSLIGVSIGRHAEMNQTLLTSVGAAVKTARRVVRSEDLLTRLAPGFLSIVCAGTIEADAHRIASRLDGVLRGAVGRAGGQHQDLRVAAVSVEPGERLEESLARLMANVRERASRRLA